MIKQIKKALNENKMVSDFVINETETISNQAFYVLQKLETTRAVKTLEYQIIVYHKYMVDETEYLGSSTFVISRKLSKKELSQKISEAVFSASFVKNKAYNLVKGEKKKSWKAKDYDLKPFEIIDNIAKTFFNETSDNTKFNSLEIFLTRTTNHIVNSQGVDLKKTLNVANVEAIPSYDGESNKVELYKYYTYPSIDFEKIKEDAVNSLNEVTARYNAQNIKDLNKVDILLKNYELIDFFTNLISDYSYISVFKQNTNKKIGDDIQENAEKDRLVISLIPSSKADAFDRDGVILNQVKVVEEGKLVNYFGDNQYAHYLGLKPSGLMNTIKVEKGKTLLLNMTKDPHLEIIALSNIQIDMYNDYIGGEVRLAYFFDGKNYTPLSGFSFSGSMKHCLKTIILSKETISINKYQGPKYIKLHGLEILS